MKQWVAMTCRDGSVWGLPVSEVARSRAMHYADEFGNDVERSLAEDTLPLFESAPYEIIDWAGNNMNFSDYKSTPVLLEPAPDPDFDEAYRGWERGEEYESLRLHDGPPVEVKP